jgi:hypothetical protein
MTVPTPCPSTPSQLSEQESWLHMNIRTCPINRADRWDPHSTFACATRGHLGLKQARRSDRRAEVTRSQCLPLHSHWQPLYAPCLLVMGSRPGLWCRCSGSTCKTMENSRWMKRTLGDTMQDHIGLVHHGSQYGLHWASLRRYRRLVSKRSQLGWSTLVIVRGPCIIRVPTVHAIEEGPEPSSRWNYTI